MFVTTIPPKHCPNCGHAFEFDYAGKAEFFDGASQQCPDCEELFQYAPHEAIVTASRPYGDLHQYAGEAE